MTEPTPHATTGGPTGVSGVAIFALVLGGLGAILGCPFTFFALPLPILGLILGFYALGKPNSRGVAIGAIVVSAVGLLTILVMGVVAAIGIGAAAAEDSTGPTDRWGDTGRTPAVLEEGAGEGGGAGGEGGADGSEGLGPGTEEGAGDR